ncbi:MAG: hypothetical protein GY757_28205, partial [bacterium]|nr:hypothetical protein [bacterium]
MKRRTLFSIYLSVILLLGTGTFLQGLEPDKNIDHYNVEIHTTENGLPQNSILSMVQTRDGYLWMGTYEGFARFDGVAFRVFDKSNTPEMTSNRAKVLLEDGKGNLWIGTSNGLLCYSNGGFINYTTQQGLSTNSIRTLYEDHHGNLWVGTTHGLNRFEKKSFVSFTTQEGLSENYILSIGEDQAGHLLIGTSGGGLNIMKAGKFASFPLKGVPQESNIQVIYKDKAGRTWIGTGGHGLAELKGDEYRLHTTKNGLSGNDIRAIHRDSRDTLWIGTNGQGLNRFIKKSFSFSTSVQSLFMTPIRTILEDHEGSLWIGTRSGLSQLKEDKFVLYNKRNGLPADSVRCVFQDNRGYIWLGMVNDGLARLKNGVIKTYGPKEGLQKSDIWSIAQSGDGSIWLGTYGNGLLRLKNDRIMASYTTSGGLSNNIIRAVFVDSADNLWVGTDGGGIDVLKNGKFTNYSSKNGLSDDFIYSVNEDKKGNIWIGTYQGNLNKFSNGNFEVFGIKNGLPGPPIWSIFCDDNEEGTIWIGTDGGGLLRFKNNSFQRYTMKDGLYNDLAFQVFKDHKQNLWMNCNQNVYSVSIQAVEDFSTGKIKQIPSISFGKSRGIKSIECNGPAQPAGICSSDGKLWFPTTHGVMVLAPGNIKRNPAIPPVVIETVRADEKIIYSYPDTPEKLLLPPGIKRLEFKFAGLSYVAPERMKFKCKLEGFDENWIALGNMRQCSYTNIEPGEYTFRVIACNNDNKWNNKGAAFAFTQQPFFRQTLWFHIMALLLFAILSNVVIGLVRKHLKLIAFWKKKKHFASYEIEKQIGIGGMGIVHKVHSLMDKSKVFAMKVMKEEHLVDETQKKRFKNESLLVDRIDHPNLVKVYERGEDNG